MNTSSLRARSIFGLICFLALASGCAATRGRISPPRLKALPLVTAPVKTDHFKRDKSGGISEQALHRLLLTPVFLEQDARIGVVQVSNDYKPDEDLPMVTVPHVLANAMESSGLFQVATEVSTDWPIDSGVAGLRELGARYRTEYLLLYRHRFIDRTYTNSLGWLYLTVIGIFTVPAETMESAGVLEATLFDVKTGTIMFTVFERVRDQRDENIWNNDRKRRELKLSLMKKAAKGLAEQTLTKLRILASSRPGKKEHEDSMASMYRRPPLSP